ncbi:hypothetical protein Pcinc_020531 [Petrolisthes cinctipes]|uniref:Uncharacterized protein n=1 Tax=Petrolisthes cinctipes TaxID=88211 RepID=A0AAE1FJ80_PETCI|nr:hypothetical protein Pcinc_020531 [Petrolisthes cinctipes]
MRHRGYSGTTSKMHKPPGPRTIARLLCHVIKTEDPTSTPRVHAVRDMAASLSFIRTPSLSQVQRGGSGLILPSTIPEPRRDPLTVRGSRYHGLIQSLQLRVPFYIPRPIRLPANRKGMMFLTSLKLQRKKHDISITCKCKKN